MGTISSRTNKIFKNRILNLNNPGQKLNVNKIDCANYLLFKKKKKIGHIKMINLFKLNEIKIEI